MIACGPGSLALKKPAILQMHHCAQLAPADGWRVHLWWTDSSLEETPVWQVCELNHYYYYYRNNYKLYNLLFIYRKWSH